MIVVEWFCVMFCGLVIEFVGIDLSFGGSCIFDGVCLCVEVGSVYVLVGLNGGGKSLLVKILFGQMLYCGELCLEWFGVFGCIGYVLQVLEFDCGLLFIVDDFMVVMCQCCLVFFGLLCSWCLVIDVVLEWVGMLVKCGWCMGVFFGGECQCVLLVQGLVLLL